MGTAAAAHEESMPGNVDSLINALTRGKIDLSLRYRYEHVDDNAAKDEADASTLRTTLGYTTGSFYDVSARILLQDVRDVGLDDFNDATGRPNAKTRFAVVADPSDTDFIEGYLGFAGVAKTTVKLGRQIITYRKAPFHRFMGTVLWRQNWQNHDAISIENKSLPHTTFRYAYSWNVNRIFTDEAIGAKANFDSNSHFINLQYDGFRYGKFEAYAYLLDFDNSVANSTATYGLRFNGGYPLSKTFKAIYTAEYASQDDYGDNPLNVNEDYFLGEIGGNVKLGNVINSLTLKFSYELLEGNGASSFRTPLATGHAYQGWADRFLTTPRDGIEDFIVTGVARAFGVKFIAAYHDLSSDNDSYDYGAELDLQATVSFKKSITVGLKYSDYNADANALNVARNGNIATDVSKLWVWTQFKY
ncbi:MAG: hypothetical protein ACE5GZ_10825 [Gammaproteobacteria bacterium]